MTDTPDSIDKLRRQFDFETLEKDIAAWANSPEIQELIEAAGGATRMIEAALASLASLAPTFQIITQSFANAWIEFEQQRRVDKVQRKQERHFLMTHGKHGLRRPKG